MLLSGGEDGSIKVKNRYLKKLKKNNNTDEKTYPHFLLSWGEDGSINGWDLRALKSAGASCLADAPGNFGGQ